MTVPNGFKKILMGVGFFQFDITIEEAQTLIRLLENQSEPGLKDLSNKLQQIAGKPQGENHATN